MTIERAHREDELRSRAVDVLIVAALFIGKMLLALWSIRPTLL